MIGCVKTKCTRKKNTKFSLRYLPLSHHHHPVFIDDCVWPTAAAPYTFRIVSPFFLHRTEYIPCIGYLPFVVLTTPLYRRRYALLPVAAYNNHDILKN